jgi:hypothetical protein
LVTTIFAVFFFALSETNDVNTGLLIEVWSKGMLWDNALGYHWIPLPVVKYSNEVMYTCSLFTVSLHFCLLVIKTAKTNRIATPNL